MKTRKAITTALLWIAVIAWSIWLGGTIYQMLVIVPAWSASPPESLQSFLAATNYNQNILKFFGPRWMPVRVLPVLGLLIFGWNLPKHRRFLIVAAVCLLAGVVFTRAYVYPINEVLFFGQPGSHSAEEIRAMAHSWILADRARLAVMSVGYLALLRAFSIAIEER